MPDSSAASLSVDEAAGVLARLLAGSWREPVAPIDEASLLALDVHAEGLLPLLFQAGGAGLLARRVAPGELSAATADELSAQHKSQVLDELMHLHHASEVVRALREIGVDPLLIKGWSVARLYPAPGLRPYRDVDVVVPAGDGERAANQLRRRLPRTIEADVHEGVRFFRGRDLAEVARREKRVDLRGLEVRVLGEEDAALLAARHLLDHGAWRAGWLVDVALLVERTPDFDWDWLLAGPARSRREVGVALLLGRELLGARLDERIAGLLPPSLPRWLLPAVRALWGRPYQLPTSLPRLPRRPRALFRELSARLRDPIAATAAVGPWNDLPRLPVQALDLAARSLRWLRFGPRRLLHEE